MKKITITVVMAMLCLNFTSKGQENKPVDVTAKGIQVGQTVPDITINNIHNYKTTTAKISDFKGKLLILDFWATWCSPCVAMIPKMDSLQKQFGDEIQFLSITYQKEKDVMPFMQKIEERAGTHYSLPIVTSEQKLHEIFPHIYLPHYVWIDGNGIVVAITELAEINEKNVEKLLKGSASLNRKIDTETKFDKTMPFLINGNGGDGKSLVYHAIFSNYQEGLESGYTITLPDSIKGGKITATNMTIPKLFALGMSNGNQYFPNNKFVFEVKDTTKFVSPGSGQVAIDWMRKNNVFSYEIIVPSHMYNKAFTKMAEDLKLNFPQYLVNIEKRKIKCMALVQLPNQQIQLKSKGTKSSFNITPTQVEIQNTYLNILISHLNMYMQKSKLPIVDDTGIQIKVDLSFTADLYSFSSINKALLPYGLQFIEKEVGTNMLVFRDK